MVEKDNYKTQLDAWFADSVRVVVAGIGNPIRMDDSIGVKIIEDLQGKVTGCVMLIQCETIPESFVQDIIRFNPTHILLIDAAVQGFRPGSVIFVKPQALRHYQAYSTHMLSLRIFCDQIRQESKADIALLLVEPENTDFGEGLTNEIAARAREIVSFLKEILP